MKKSMLIIFAFFALSISANAQYTATAFKKATLLEDGTPIVNGQTGEILRVSGAPISLSNLEIRLPDINPGKTAPNNGNQPVLKQAPPKDRDKNQLKQKKGKN